MKQGIQTNYHNEEIKKYGCYFLSILELAERLSGITINIDEAYKISKEKRWLSNECFVNNPKFIFNYAYGKDIVKDVIFSKEKPADNNLYVICNKKPNHIHFTLSDFDPLEPNRPGAKDYNIDSYRIFKI